jgi:hypothetical protein
VQQHTANIVRVPVTRVQDQHGSEKDIHAEQIMEAGLPEIVHTQMDKNKHNSSDACLPNIPPTTFIYKEGKPS